MSINKFLMVVTLSIFISACSEKSDKDTWIVATSPDNPPYEHMKDGEIEGFDIDLMTAIGQHLGKNIEFKNMEFHGLLAALATKNVDMVIAGMSITPERTARVDFSIPYAEARIAILFRRADGYKESADLKEKMVGAQLGTIWSLIAHDISMTHSFRTKALASNLMLVEELKNGRVDAVILEESQAEKFAEKNPKLSSFRLGQYGSSFAIALPKGSPEKKNIDHTIKSLKSNGTITALTKKWGLVGAD
ncbi:putative amino acid ABC transporter substrate-binding protein [Candidatus Megaera venefica]|uniref:Amino acid ABC transporter substrate-binding protein n=1 Tax=Candidatus Megaera venefica TaxID=2055910 RepID=A0ABU5NDS1_9RICK|nr:ABC transporter substrate-binding protein [Candidatus Megaera venefica]MBY0533885.1 ABC transporter substrate-binding protein [Rickettsiaceae bacterium]MEA0971310.1 putative amino acid ABC transporter substrate-binding protein [Candidatus Megaera venefica]